MICHGPSFGFAVPVIFQYVIGLNARLVCGGASVAPPFALNNEDRRLHPPSAYCCRRTVCLWSGDERSSLAQGPGPVWACRRKYSGTAGRSVHSSSLRARPEAQRQLPPSAYRDHNVSKVESQQRVDFSCRGLLKLTAPNSGLPTVTGIPASRDRKRSRAAPSTAWVTTEFHRLDLRC